MTVDASALLTGLALVLSLALAGTGLALTRWRNRAEREAAARRALENSCPIGLIRCIDGRFLPNPAARDLIDIDTGGVDRDGLLDRFEPADRLRLAEALEKLGPGDGERRLSLAPMGGGSVELVAAIRDGRMLIWVGDETALSDVLERFDEVSTGAHRLERVLDALPAPIWWRDAAGRLVGVNAAMADAMEMRPAQIIAQGKEFAAEAKALSRRAERSGVRQTESRHVVVRGERLLFDIVDTPMEGRPGETAGMALDRTALEEVTRALDRHLAAHADVMERLSTGVSIYGPDQRLQFHNTAFREIWDIPEGRLSDAPSLAEVLDLLREYRRLPEIVDFRAYVRAEQAHFTALLEPMEELLHLPDERTLKVTTAPHPMGGLLFLYQDVTDQLRLERSRNTLAQVQQATLNQLYEGVAVFGGDGRLRLWNPVFAALWRFDQATLASGPHIGDLMERVRPLMRPETADQWAAFRDAMILAVTQDALREGRVERADGAVLDYAAMPLPDGQRLLLLQDVTDSVRVERALAEKDQALTRTERLKSTLISNISYGLRSPLNSILGFSELLASEAAGPLTARQKDYLADILKAAEDLSHLVGDVIDQAAIDAGYLQLDLALIDMGRLMGALAERHRVRAGELGIAFEAKLAPDLGRVLADGARLRQALDALIVNALDVTREGGRMVLTAARLNGGIEIAVTDAALAGGGEAPETGFDRFEFQEAGPLGRSGLGLSLARGIVELHRGRLTRTASPDGIARVVCWLPSDPTAQPTARVP